MLSPTSKQDVEIPSKPKGWIRASVLENYSSLNELSLFGLLGSNLRWPRKHFFIQFSFNLHTPLKIHPKAYLTFHVRDACFPTPNKCSYSFSELTRWRLRIESYKTMEDFLNNSKRWQRCNYAKSKKMFENYDCKTTLIETDWTE